MAKAKRAGDARVQLDPRSMGTWGWKRAELPEDEAKGIAEALTSVGPAVDPFDDDYLGLEELDNVKVIITKKKKRSSIKRKAADTNTSDTEKENEDELTESTVAFELVDPANKPKKQNKNSTSSSSSSKPAETEQQKKKDKKDKKDKSKESSKCKSKDKPACTSEAQPGACKKKEKKEEQIQVGLAEMQELNGPELQSEMKEWVDIVPELDVEVLSGLRDLKFFTPTEVQKHVLPAAVTQSKCILAAAETGSGKTLAFGIPLIQRVLCRQRQGKEPFTGLIIAPTRELAIQVNKHLQSIIKPYNGRNKDSKMYSIALVGGLAESKQKRLLTMKTLPHIVVGTPGRLLDLIRAGLLPPSKLATLKMLVLDEVDKLLERKRFPELYEILDLIKNPTSRNASLQVMAFSATIPDNEVISKYVDAKKRVCFDLKKPKVTASGLVEYRADILPEERESTLYYLLKYHKPNSISADSSSSSSDCCSRVIVFVNAIKVIKNLVRWLRLLGYNAHALHAQMQQRQRLKSIDNFTETSNTVNVLVASNVAARGLDLPSVDLVVHFHCPDSTELYVHRSGRAARGLETAASVVLVTPSEMQKYKTLCKDLKRQVKEYQIDNNILKQLQKRVNLATKIAVAEVEKETTRRTKSWESKTLAELELDSDDSDEDNSDGNDDNDFDLAGMKRTLQKMISQDVVIPATKRLRL